MRVVPYLPQNKPTYLSGCGNTGKLFWKVLREELISLTAYIQAVTAAMDMYIPIMEDESVQCKI